MNVDKITKIVVKVLPMVLILVGVILAITVAGGDSVDTNGKVTHPESAILSYLSMGEWEMIGCIFLIVIFSLVSIVMDVKHAIPGIAGMVVFGVILLIAYNSASDFVPESWISKDPSVINPTASDSQWAGMGLIATYILGAITIAAIFAGEVWQMVKNLK